MRFCFLGLRQHLDALRVMLDDVIVRGGREEAQPFPRIGMDGVVVHEGLDVEGLVTVGTPLQHDGRRVLEDTSTLLESVVGFANRHIDFVGVPNEFVDVLDFVEMRRVGDDTRFHDVGGTFAVLEATSESATHGTVDLDSRFRVFALSSDLGVLRSVRVSLDTRLIEVGISICADGLSV